MAAQQIVIFQKDAFDTPILIDRDEYHNDRAKYHDYYGYVVDLFIFNSHGELFVQKRSMSKSKNPWKYHTSVGAHVNPQEKASFTILHKCLGEIGAPCFLAQDAQEFEKGFPLVSDYSDKYIYLLSKGDRKRDIVLETPEGTDYIKDKSFLCFGLYDGPVQLLDRSVSGYELMSLPYLESALAQNPQAFTGSFTTYFHELKDEMQTFIDTYCQD